MTDQMIVCPYCYEEYEPTYLPGRIPNLIVNGTSGIAVAMACSFAPHNLNEVMDAAIHVASNPERSLVLLDLNHGCMKLKRWNNEAVC